MRVDLWTEEIRALIPAQYVLPQEPMTNHTSFRIGGPADLLVLPQTAEQIIKIIDFCRRNGIPHLVIGNGSNLLVRDGGIRGIVIKIAANFSQIQVQDRRIKAQAGASLNSIAFLACRKGLTGLEFAAGIPGTIGGAVYMNAGAYNGEMKDVLVQATILTTAGRVETWSEEELGLAYRHSNVSAQRGIVLDVLLELQKKDPESIRTEIRRLLALRKAKQPLDWPSAGSTFKRPPDNYAGALIEKAGLKGARIGDAQVSNRHAGFIINKGHATAQDVIQLIKHIQKTVYDKFGVQLEPEVRIVGEDRT
ncbi:MAG: UDP-N-acetylmuramate dehydrogenase [Limnochordia bacterium]